MLSQNYVMPKQNILMKITDTFKKIYLSCLSYSNLERYKETNEELNVSLGYPKRTMCKIQTQRKGTQILQMM